MSNFVQLQSNQKLLTLEEVAEYLRVSKATIRRLTNRGKLSCYRLGGKSGKRLFSPDQVLAFLAGCEQGRLA
jgi:excisionase family DNA binding protein